MSTVSSGASSAPAMLTPCMQEYLHRHLSRLDFPRGMKPTLDRYKSSRPTRKDMMAEPFKGVPCYVSH
jgi:hypothetical protein